MLRFLLRRLPRFGFMTLFAAMLLFVSGAGWFKFHYDLYQEEERLLADLAKAECQVLIERFSEPSRSSAPAETLWTPLPQLDRLRNLRIKHPAPIEPALVDRAAPYAGDGTAGGARRSGRDGESVRRSRRRDSVIR